MSPGRRTTRCGRSCAFPSLSRLPRSSRACAACSISPPIPMRSAPSWRRIRRSRRWSPRARASGARRLGRIRTRGARGARPADHGARPPSALAGKLVAAYGEPLLSAGPRRPVLTHVFPEPRGSGRRRSGRARHAARARGGAVGRGRGRRRRSRPLRRRAAAWKKPSRSSARLPGIGEWTAQYIAMRQLREPDAFPAADIGLMRAHGRRGRRQAERRRAARPRRALAALARLCRAASLGARGPLRGRANRRQAARRPPRRSDCPQPDRKRRHERPCFLPRARSDADRRRCCS